MQPNGVKMTLEERALLINVAILVKALTKDGSADHLIPDLLISPLDGLGDLISCVSQLQRDEEWLAQCRASGAMELK
jgi:hypothetical protein